MMLYSSIAAGGFGSRALEWIEAASLVIEVLAVTIIVVAILYTVVRYLLWPSVRRENTDWHHDFKVSLGKSLLLGLELLLAADVVRTVALDWSFESVAVLGLLVLIRTILSWSLLVEMEGRWPWQEVPWQGHASAHEETPPAGEPGPAALIESGGV